MFYKELNGKKGCYINYYCCQIKQYYPSVFQASAVQLCIKYTPPVKAVVGSSVDSKPDDKGRKHWFNIHRNLKARPFL